MDIGLLIGIIIFKFISFWMIGLTGDSLFNAILKWVDGEITYDDKFLPTNAYLIQTLMYVSMFMLVFEPLHLLIGGWFILLRYIFWGITVATIEFLFGLFFDKVFHKRLWDFRGWKLNILGYTTVPLIFLWGAFGLLAEGFTAILNYLAPYFVEWFRIFNWVGFLIGM